MTLHQITQVMTRYNREVAYGSECNAWQDYVADCFAQHKISPWDDSAADVVVSADFAEYWSLVASGTSADYDAETGGRSEQ